MPERDRDGWRFRVQAALTHKLDSGANLSGELADKARRELEVAR